MSGRRRALALWTGLAVVGLVACGVPADDRAHSVDPSEVPARLVRPSTTVATSTPGGPALTAPPVPSDAVELWFVRDDVLVAATRRLDLPVTPADVLAALARGPDASESADRFRRTALEGAPTLVGIDKVGVATVSLPREFVDDATTRSEQVLVIAQIVETLTGLDDVAALRFEFADQPQAVPLPGSSAADPGDPVTAEDYASLLPA